MEDIVSDKQDIVIGRFRLRTWPRGKDASRANRNRDSMPTENVRARIKKRQAGA